MTDLQPLADGARALSQRAAGLVGRVDAQRDRVVSLSSEVDGLEATSSLLTLTTASLDKLLELLTVESVGKVEALVTHGLRTVFPDQELSFRFEITTKFRQPWLEPRLIDRGIEAPILDAFGGGPASLVAFILRVVVISRMHLAPVLFLDEPFAMVSQEYVDRVGWLLRDLCKSLGLTVVMVTQQRAFRDHADIAYEAEGDPHGPRGTTFARSVGAGSDSPLVGSSPTTP